MKQVVIGFIGLLVIGILLFFLYGNDCKKDPICRYKIQGIDVSRWQLDIDWKKVERSPVRFVFIKATEGKNEADKFFEQNWEAIEKTTLLRGAYHFYRPKIHSKEQAANFIKTVTLKKGDLPPVLDLEETDGKSKQIVIKGVKNWLTLIEEHYEVKPIIYVNHHYYNNYVKGNFEDYIIWIASYEYHPKISQKKWHFWQYSNTGENRGIKEPVDLNVFQGSFNDLQALTVQ